MPRNATRCLALFLVAVIGNTFANMAAGQPGPGNRTDDQSHFSLRQGEKGHWWIMDGDDKVAIFGPSMKGRGTYSLGLVRQTPGQEVPAQWLIEPQVLHLVSRQGLSLTTYWMNKGMQGVRPAMQVDQSDPQRLIIRLVSEKSKSDRGEFTICVRRDQQLRRYVVEIALDLLLSERGGGEFCNYYPGGAGDLRPESNRYDRLVWQEADGTLKSHWLSFPVAQPGPINLASTAVVAYGDEKRGNPAVFFESAQPPVKIDVCYCWFDSHLTWTEPADMPGPPYHYTAKFKAYWLNAKESAELLAKSQQISLAPFAARFQQWIPLQMGKVNDFEQRVDLAGGKTKHFYLELRPGISYDSTTGHSGSHSLRFESPGNGTTFTLLTAPEFLVTPGKRLRVSAWVKTEGVSGEGFYLETGFQRWLPSGLKDLGPVYQSPKLNDTRDWTRIEIP